MSEIVIWKGHANNVFCLKSMKTTRVYIGQWHKKIVHQLKKSCNFSV